jgi:hypothetical protein
MGLRKETGKQRGRDKRLSFDPQTWVLEKSKSKGGAAEAQSRAMVKPETHFWKEGDLPRLSHTQGLQVNRNLLA